MPTLADLIAGLEDARRYTVALLDRIDPAAWFRMTPGDVTHVAWQVGHLATAQYSLALVRTRGERPEDATLLPESFRARFGRGSVPSPDPSAYPPPAQIRDAFDRVHQQALSELANLEDSERDAPAIGKPHPLFTTKGGALTWCARHEFVHAGQITLIRRLLGGEPNW